MAYITYEFDVCMIATINTLKTMKQQLRSTTHSSFPTSVINSSDKFIKLRQ